MLDVDTELLHLAWSDRQITEGHARIRQQIALVRQLQSHGVDPTLARQLLAALRSSVNVQRQHRALIVQVLNDYLRFRYRL